MQSRLIVFVCALIVGVIAPAGISAQVSSPVPTAISLPTPTGSYAVGRTSVEWIDTAEMSPSPQTRRISGSWSSGVVPAEPSSGPKALTICRACGAI